MSSNHTKPHRATCRLRMPVTDDEPRRDWAATGLIDVCSSDWGPPQGLRIKVGVLEYVQQVVRVEGRLHAFGFGAVLDGVVLPQ